MSLLFEKALGVLGFFSTGSRVICDPAPQNTDEDYVIFTDDRKSVRTQLENLGYTYTSAKGDKYKNGVTDEFRPYNEFDSYRHVKNDHNLIVVSSAGDFKRWKVATLVAKELNIMDKAKRAMLFRAIRSGGTIFTDPKDIEL